MHAPLRALVTGAASGAGAACAYALADRGVDLVLVDCDAEPLRLVAEATGAQALVVDVSAKRAVAGMAIEVLRQSPPHLLINAAGAGYVRVLGMLTVSDAFVGDMVAAGDRRFIVNLTAKPAPTRFSQPFSYAASPVAFAQLSAALSARTDGTEVNVISVNCETSDSAANDLVDVLCREAGASRGTDMRLAG
ncbi:SDR family NAD(P)-dependent oxidoreductase [Sphingomonas sabuli]|uniref:SDR family NAD(P)-dependent oxidoreductase n=1 Tax=Sphingomonas sabuli TaxID=2764186 RepID=A0A7G9KZE5_9SPHN|nr:SDR family NAD(P)-dependent oxidoreductase [Sphingomonas sabuli]QNM81744.1 SDR family NAD(P)-dependent oxidoreductase [Sphingomonas sabuli]